MLLLDERITRDGSIARTWASYEGERFVLHDEAGPLGTLPLIAVDQVMQRYGRALDRNVVLEDPSLCCASYRLRRLRYFSVVDAEARDYLVWESPTAEPLACLAVTATAALRYLASGRLARPGKVGNGE